MATVYRAYDQRLQRIVALKILHEHLTSDPDLSVRFNQEAKLAARIDHPNVVRIYDIGVNSQNQLFIVSEFIDGQSLTLALRQYMNRTNPYLNPVLAALVGHEIARGIGAAHGHQVVHRDLKPDNVLVSNGGDVKLTDFGVARPFDSSMTQAGQFIGSLTYASPEQVSGTKVDTRSDIFSFGVILFELLTGQLPFRSSNPTDLAIKITQAQIPPLNRIRPSVPLELDSIVRKCLRANPEERPQNAAQIVHELSQFIARNEVQISAAMIHDGFKNPNLFNSTIKRSPLLTEDSSEKNRVAEIVKNPDETIHLSKEELQPFAAPEALRQAEQQPQQLQLQNQPIQLQVQAPSQKHTAQDTPRILPAPAPHKASREQFRKPKAAAVPPHSIAKSKTSGIPLFVLFVSVACAVLLAFGIKNRETLRQLLSETGTARNTADNQTTSPETPAPFVQPAEAVPASVVTERPTPSASAQLPTPAAVKTPLPVKTRGPVKTSVPSKRPASHPTASPLQQKPKPAPVPQSKTVRNPIKPKNSSAAASKSAPRPIHVPKNTAAETPAPIVIVKTNVDFTVKLSVYYPPKRDEHFLGYSETKPQQREFSEAANGSLKAGSAIIKAEPYCPESDSFESAQQRVTLKAGQKTPVTINLPKKDKATAACPKEVRSTGLKGHTAERDVLRPLRNNTDSSGFGRNN